MIPSEIYLVARKTVSESLSSQDDDLVLYIAFCIVVIALLALIIFILLYSTGWWSRMMYKAEQKNQDPEILEEVISDVNTDITVPCLDETESSESVYHTDFSHNRSYKNPIMSVSIIPTLPTDLFVLDDAEPTDDYVYVSFVTHQ